MVESVRLSAQTMLLLSVLLEDHGGWSYGYDLSQRTKLKSGTLYPILIRLTERGWLETKWEFGEDKGKPRHMYRLTAGGRRRAMASVLEAEIHQPHLQPEPAR